MEKYKINSKELSRLLLLIEGVVIQLENNKISVMAGKTVLNDLKLKLKRYLNFFSKEMDIPRFISSQQYEEIKGLVSIADKLVIQAYDAKLISNEFVTQYNSMKSFLDNLS